MGSSKFKKDKPKIVVIVGPTASGKSSLAVKLAKKFNGEIVSADSRQVYRGMDIGTGKISKKEMEDIPHHLLSIVSPKTKFTVVQYQKQALAVIKKILSKNRLPFLVGGTGFYIQAVIDGLTFPKVPPNWQLRKKLEKKTAKELFLMLKKLDPKRAKTIEKENKRRVIRAIEIVTKTKKPVPKLIKNSPFEVLMIGIKKSKQELKKLIKKRLFKRLKQGMITEVKKLKKSGVSQKRLEEFGLEYKWIARYLAKKISYQEMLEKLEKDIQKYARRQMTWFKRDRRIHWVTNYQRAKNLIHKFIVNGVNHKL